MLCMCVHVGLSVGVCMCVSVGLRVALTGPCLCRVLAVSKFMASRGLHNYTYIVEEPNMTLKKQN